MSARFSRVNALLSSAWTRCSLEPQARELVERGDAFLHEREAALADRDRTDTTEAFCGHCDEEFDTLAAPCPRCGDYRHLPGCGRCSCPPATAEKLCTRCFLRRPATDFTEHDDAQAEFSLSFPCPPERHPDYPAHLCIRRILDDGLSSRLPFEIVERRGLAYSLHAGIDAFTDAGMTVVDGACAPAKLPRVLEEVLRVLGTLAARSVPEEELLRVQRRHRMTLAFSLDSAAELAGWYGSGEVLSAPEGFEERCRRVERVSPADVARVARATFRRRNAISVVVGPARRRERIAVERLLARTTAVPT